MKRSVSLIVMVCMSVAMVNHVEARGGAGMSGKMRGRMNNNAGITDSMKGTQSRKRSIDMKNSSTAQYDTETQQLLQPLMERREELRQLRRTSASDEDIMAKQAEMANLREQIRLRIKNAEENNNSRQVRNKMQGSNLVNDIVEDAVE